MVDVSGTGCDGETPANELLDYSGVAVVTGFAFGNFIDGELSSMPAVKDVSSSIVLKVVKPKQTMIT